MNDILRNRILRALEVADNPAVGRDALLAALRELDAVAVESASELPGDLAHYLARRSYAKARVALEHPGTPHRP